MSWTHLQEGRPVARKQYYCCLCGLPIPSGIQYAKRVGVMDGEMVAMRMHLQCEQASSKLTVEEWETFPDAGDFQKYNLAPAALAEIKALMAAKEGR